MTETKSTEGVAGGIDTLFRSLYTLFFLRDVMGKMAPGTIALFVAGLTWPRSDLMDSVS